MNLYKILFSFSFCLCLSGFDIFSFFLVASFDKPTFNHPCLHFNVQSNNYSLTCYVINTTGRRGLLYLALAAIGKSMFATNHTSQKADQISQQRGHRGQS